MPQLSQLPPLVGSSCRSSSSSSKSTSKRNQQPPHRQQLMTKPLISCVTILISVIFCVTLSSATVSNAFLTAMTSTITISPCANHRRNRIKPSQSILPPITASTSSSSSDTTADVDDDDDAVVVTWLEEDDIAASYKSSKQQQQQQQPKTTTASTTTASTTTTATNTKWGSKLSPQVKERIILAGQQRAISNKQKRISDMDRKRSQLMFVKERQREKKLINKIDRPIPLKASASADVERIPLHVYQPGMKCFGTCISLTNFGAYIDIGTECDGLLHVTQMHSSTGSTDRKGKSTTTSTFINHPKQIVQPGDEILVTVRSINPTRKKLHLTLLPWDVVQEQLTIERETKELKRAKALSFDDDDDDNGSTEALTISYTDRIPLSDIQIDDELWGEIKRVTDFGAYVEVGAIVDGFLHYMDHPSFTYEHQPVHPTSIMKSGDRVRVWVSDIDSMRNRIKLTAQRPNHLPGPRREM